MTTGGARVIRDRLACTQTTGGQHHVEWTKKVYRLPRVSEREWLHSEAGGYRTRGTRGGGESCSLASWSCGQPGISRRNSRNAQGCLVGAWIDQRQLSVRHHWDIARLHCRFHAPRR